MDAISFGTDGWRATLDEFTSERVRTVAQGIAGHLEAAGRAGDPVAVCHDARESSPGFAADVADVLTANGHDVYRPERDRPTPLLAYAVVDRGLAGGVMVTASHNPPAYNGVKFLPADGAPATPDVTDAIEANLAPPAEADDDGARGDVYTVDFRGPHADHALSLAGDLVGADLDGLPVVYDAMHGSGRGVTDRLLERAGADVTRVRCDRDPAFGGTGPDPVPENLGPLREAVAEAGATLGVANDGDADRVAVVTPDGALGGSQLFAVLYDALLEAASGPAVRTVSTTFLVDRIAEAHGESVVETPVGFKWVAEAMAEHDALLGGEESGGYSVRGHVREKDGVLVGLLAAAVAAERPLADRLADLYEAHGEIRQGRVSVDCPDERKPAVLEALGDALPDRVAGVAVDRVVDVDGFKILLADGSWLLVRPSGTEPALRVYAEADGEDRVEALLAAGRDLVAPLV
ncbi:MAG: phosphoglucomutase/phosphomannomutase family protein [Halobacteriaceae archaeon]